MKTRPAAMKPVLGIDDLERRGQTEVIRIDGRRYSTPTVSAAPRLTLTSPEGGPTPPTALDLTRM